MSHPDGNPSSSYDQSSSWMKSFPPTTRDKNKCVSEDSDEEDLFTVPDIEAAARPTTESSAAGKAIEGSQLNNTTSLAANGKRRRGRNPADREYRRLKRLLRNRVSAQQARERKKAYVNDLESKAKDLQDKNSNLEEKISTLINENTMLRKVLMNTRPKVDESSDSKQDQSVRADS